MKTAILAVTISIIAALAAACSKKASADKWAQHFGDEWPSIACAAGGPFMTCFKLSEGECKKHARVAVDECLGQINGSLPDKLDDQAQKKYGADVGGCAGTAFARRAADKYVAGCDLQAAARKSAAK